MIKDYYKKFKSKHGIEVIWYKYGIHIGFNCGSLCIPVIYCTLPLCTEHAFFVSYECGYYISKLVPRCTGKDNWLFPNYFTSIR